MTKEIIKTTIGILTTITLSSWSTNTGNYGWARDKINEPRTKNNLPI